MHTSLRLSKTHTFPLLDSATDSVLVDEAVADDDEAVTDDDEAVTDDDEAVTDDDEAVADDDDPPSLDGFSQTAVETGLPGFTPDCSASSVDVCLSEDAEVLETAADESASVFTVDCVAVSFVDDFTVEQSTGADWSVVDDVGALWASSV